MFNKNDSSLYWFRKAFSFKPGLPSAFRSASIALVRQDYATAERMFRQYATTSEPDQKAQAEDMLALIPFPAADFRSRTPTSPESCVL